MKGDLLFGSDGLAVFATHDPNLALMEWKRREVCALAHTIQRVLKQHALNTTFIDRLGEHALVVRRADRLDLVVEATSGTRESSLRWLSTDGGGEISEGELTGIPGVKPDRVDMMKDAAIHSARSLRAHLHGDRLRLRLRFGTTGEGDCLMEVPDPLDCDFGPAPYDQLIVQIGGTAT